MSNDLENLTTLIAAKKNSMGVAKHAMVAACHPQSTAIGLAVLKSGGSAVDSFIATTFAEYVLAPGTTSMAGELSLLVYNSAEKESLYLHGGFKTPQLFKGKDSLNAGNSILIPGAIAGLEAAHSKFGRLPWEKLIEPAINLANDGFEISPLYEDILHSRHPLLKKSPYACHTFFKDGEPLKQGDYLCQPTVAQTLERIASEGSTFFYKGDWAKAFIEAVRKHGGNISLEDMAAYKPLWVPAWKTHYKDNEVHSTNLPAYGGIKVALGLKLLEYFNLGERKHWSVSSDSLELMIRIARFIESGHWLYGNNALNEYLAQGQIPDEYISALAEEIYNPIQPNYALLKGTHSYHIIVVDQDGNIASGTHTIGSLPWGDYGIFVGGVPLTSAGIYASQTPGEFIPDPFSIHFALQNNSPILAVGTFASSMFPADLQILSNLLDFKMSPEEAILTPRFGTFVHNFHTMPISVDTTKNFLDKRIPVFMVSYLKSRGIQVEQEGFVDTGMGVVVQIQNSPRQLYGMTPEFLDGVAKGY